MENTINSLVEIEQRANAILQNAADVEEKIAKEYAVKTAEFDNRLSDEVEKKLSAIKDKLDVELNSELEVIRKTNDAVYDRMKYEYDNNHTKIAKDIVKRMIAEKTI